MRAMTLVVIVDLMTPAMPVMMMMPSVQMPRQHPGVPERVPDRQRRRARARARDDDAMPSAMMSRRRSSSRVAASEAPPSRGVKSDSRSLSRRSSEFSRRPGMRTMASNARDGRARDARDDRLRSAERRGRRASLDACVGVASVDRTLNMDE